MKEITEKAKKIKKWTSDDNYRDNYKRIFEKSDNPDEEESDSENK